VVGLSAIEALVHVQNEKVEQAERPADETPLGPGIRIVDGRPLYSAAWLDFEAPRAA